MKIKIKFTQFALIVLTIIAFISSVQAITFTVNDTEDAPDIFNGDGFCTAAFPNHCTLRAAIMEINFLNQPSNTIILPSGIYTLTRPNTLGVADDAQGDLNLNANVTINGSDARTTIIQAGTTKSTNSSNGNGIDRVIRILGSDPLNIGRLQVFLNSVTIRNGKTLNPGGGILEEASVLTINNSAILDNNGAGGAGIASFGKVNIKNSIISGNIGGGFGNVNSPNVSSLTNVTISGNSADFGAGGIYNVRGSLIVTNCTISHNTNAASGTFNAGGIARSDQFGAVTNIRNTIITNNFVNTSIPRDVGGTVISSGTNLIGNAGTSTGWIGSDLLNNTSANLLPLANNGGQTDTHAISSNSAALNAGQNCVVNNICPVFNAPFDVTTDQRGQNRLFAGFALEALFVDIGAFEKNTLAPTSAEASISGRVTTASGRGIRNVRISLSKPNGETLFATTNPFGYYRFKELQTGETYILNVNSKRYSFAEPTRVINLNEDLTDENFVSNDK
jgi:Carboxypeptidase regulatory-like domain